MAISSKLINIMSIKPSCQIELTGTAQEPHRPGPALAVRLLAAADISAGRHKNRSLLASPARGLAWSNPNISDEALVRNALMKGGYDLVLDAVLGHGLDFVRRQWALMEADSDVALTPMTRADMSRKLTNIERGLKLAAA